MASILVIADDLTGAAEIGGIALRYNLTVDIVHELDAGLQSDVQILNSNTRSLKEDEIIPHLKKITAELDKKAYPFIYLKFDSALRGFIKKQIEFFKDQLQFQTVLFSPANPSFGRIIENGVYYINGTLINETSFSEDPEFPIKDQHVLSILQAPNWKLVQAPNNPDVTEGCLIAEVSTQEQLDLFAQDIHSGFLLAGGSAFFDAILHHKYKQFKIGFREHVELNYPILYVCGSAYEGSLEKISKVKPEYVVFMGNKENDEKVKEELINKLKERSRVIFAVSPETKGNAAEIRKRMALIVAYAYNKTEICELVIEGGATSFEILNELNIKVITPVQEIGLGLIKTIVEGKQLFITLKPGSYPWKNELWEFK